ncbi:MAG TPA: hypothetical protein VFW87_22315 [Pirellulales bacterium]|nr:hypothetical protein [Pirellulales bacterium]
MFQYPLAVAAHGDTIYVADRNLPGVWKIEDGKPSVYYRGEKTFRTPLNAPRCVAVDAEGRVLVGDSATREVYRIEEGKLVPLTKGGIGIPLGIAVDRAGDLLVSDLELNRIVKVTLSGDDAPRVEKYVDVPAPAGVFLDQEDRLWVVSRRTDALLRVSSERKVEVIVTGRVFGFPHAVLLDGEGTAYLSDGYGKAIWKVDGEGKATKWVSGEPLLNPVGIAWQGETLLVADPHAKAIFQIDPRGKISTVAPSTAATSSAPVRPAADH